MVPIPCRATPPKGAFPNGSIRMGFSAVPFISTCPKKTRDTSGPNFNVVPGTTVTS